MLERLIEPEILAPETKAEEDIDALTFLQRRYRDPNLPDNVRERCARVCLPFERPKLEAIATINPNGDYHDQLERARQRSKAAMNETPKRIEPQSERAPTMNGKSPEQVSSEKMGKSFSSLRPRRF